MTAWLQLANDRATDISIFDCLFENAFGGRQVLRICENSKETRGASRWFELGCSANGAAQARNICAGGVRLTLRNTIHPALKHSAMPMVAPSGAIHQGAA